MSSECNYREALKIKTLYSPEDSRALVLLGVLEFVKFPEREQAVPHLKKALQMDPYNIATRFWLAVCLHHYFDEYDKAEEILLKAFEFDPNRGSLKPVKSYLSFLSFQAGSFT